MLAWSSGILKRPAQKTREGQNGKIEDAGAISEGAGRRQELQARKTEAIVLQAIGPMLSADIGSRAVVLQATLQKVARLLSVQKYSLWVTCQDGFFCSDEEWCETSFQRRLVPRRWIHKDVFGPDWDRLLAGEAVSLGISEGTPPAHPLRSLVRDDPGRSLIAVPVLRKSELRSLVLIKVSRKRRQLLLREAISLKTIAHVLEGLHDSRDASQVEPSGVRHSPARSEPTHLSAPNVGKMQLPYGQTLMASRTFPHKQRPEAGGQAPASGPERLLERGGAMPVNRATWFNRDKRRAAGEGNDGMPAFVLPAWWGSNFYGTPVPPEGDMSAAVAMGEQATSPGRLAGQSAWHDQLARELAHDFNNVIASIAGSAALIEMRPEEDSVYHARRILEAADQASGLVRKILERDAQSGQSQPIRFCESVKKAAAIVRPTLPDDIVLEITCHTGSDHIRVEPTEFFQVILNLVVNSRDAFPAGQLDRWIRVSGFAAPPEMLRGKMAIGAIDSRRRYVCLEVCDNGCGMEASVSMKMFHPYFTTKGVDGTGLGMSIVSRIVRANDGTIQVDSELGAGTRVRIFWPLMEAQTDSGSDTMS